MSIWHNELVHILCKREIKNFRKHLTLNTEFYCRCLMENTAHLCGFWRLWCILDDKDGHWRWDSKLIQKLFKNIRAYFMFWTLLRWSLNLNPSDTHNITIVCWELFRLTPKSSPKLSNNYMYLLEDKWF